MKSFLPFILGFISGFISNFLLYKIKKSDSLKKEKKKKKNIIKSFISELNRHKEILKNEIKLNPNNIYENSNQILSKLNADTYNNYIKELKLYDDIDSNRISEYYQKVLYLNKEQIDTHDLQKLLSNCIEIINRLNNAFT